MAAKKRRKSGLHSAGKSTEADIVARARELYDDPEHAIVRCEGSCVLFSPVRRAEAHIRKAWAAREDEKKLTKLASSGSHLGRAYAATLLVARSGKVPYVGTLRMMGGVEYAQRGRALPMFLAGVQHHDDQRLRLLSVAKYVKQRKIHCYSGAEGIVCTGRRAAPPRAFVEGEMAALDLEAKTPERFTCVHGGIDHGEALVIEWRTAAVTAEVCTECASAERNTLHQIVQHMATPDPVGEFEVRVEFAPLLIRAGGKPPAFVVEPPAKELRDYVNGKAADEPLLAAARVKHLAGMRKIPGPFYAAARDSFGADLAAFIDHLKPSDLERRALTAALSGTSHTVVVERASPARALAEVWKARGKDALAAAAGGNAEVAEHVYREDATPDQITDLLQRAQREGDERRVAAALPRYRKLPAPAAIADQIARTYRARGREDAARLALTKVTESRERGVCLAFMRLLGAAHGQDWRFSGVEQGLADTLEPSAQRLLDATSAEEYHATLEAIAAAAGATGALERA